MNINKDNNKIMKNNVITVNYDNVKYRLVVGDAYFTAYYRDGEKPQRFNIFDDASIAGFLHLASIKDAKPSKVTVHATKKNTFVWGGVLFDGVAPTSLIERYDAQNKKYSINTLNTKYGKRLARAILRRKAQQAA